MLRLLLKAARLQKAPLDAGPTPLKLSGMRQLSILVLLSFLLSGCSKGEASHLPSPFVWPFEALRNAISNSRYDAKRNKLKGYLEQNLQTFESELNSQPAATFQRALELAKIPPTKSTEVFQRLQEDLQQHQQNTPPAERSETYTITLMVHGGH